MKNFLIALVIFIFLCFGGYYLISNKIISINLGPSPSPSTLIVGNDRDEHGCIGSAGYSWCSSKEKCLRTWEEECDQTKEIIAAIKAQIIAKRGQSANQLNYSVSKVEGNYAQGGASAEGGGAMWFAAKVGDEWKLVWDGNGVIECSSISPYPDFPKSMISECWDQTKNKNIIR